MHRLPQCHLVNPRVECQNIYQVNQYDTPLSPWVFNCNTYIKCSQIHKSIQSDNNKISKGKTQFITTRYRGENTIRSNYINKDRDTSRSWHLKNTRERENKHIATGTNPQPRGWTTPSSSWWPRDDEDGHQWWFPPPVRCRNGLPIGFRWLQRLAAVKLPI